MKPFDQTRFYTWLAGPLLKPFSGLPPRLAYFLPRVILGILTAKGIQGMVPLCYMPIGNPADFSTLYYTLLLLETVRYAAQLWSIWYVTKQFSILLMKPGRPYVMTPDSVGFAITFLYLITLVQTPPHPPALASAAGLRGYSSAALLLASCCPC